ncbi:hypothetical protein MBCUT_10420 [Methanobrevibacter cuticularis]|uniref:N-acetyltransferase domain-containing protein n=1 Tax=Methanobrevibacter cuticularis TaxID=47311 RepID=A0A166E1L7_9EURY|nr:hypothetical protein [Methanobrevibacter cuticularis]KZX16176.1 hypothetical protein MBCUT_10420 [Methanobrevibacter cuticularis]
MITRILLDTNIIIYREDNKLIDEKLQQLLKTINTPEYHLLIHPLAIKEIKGDKVVDRREIMLSKLNSYDEIKNYPNFDKDNDFKYIVKPKDNSHDYVDNCLIYAILKDEASFLITEDEGIHKKASKLNNLEENFSDRIFTISEALENFSINLPVLPYTIKYTTVNYLDLEDPIFDTLKADYPEFNKWFESISRKRRECLVYEENGKSIGALLIYKEETESIDLLDRTLPPKDRMKIATLVVTSTGYKIGEFFLSWILKYSLDKNIKEIYLTHFIKPDDPLVYLIEEYGFNHAGDNSRGEAIYIKVIDEKEVKNSINELIGEKSPLDLAKNFYPEFYDGEKVNKYIVPIKPEFHEKLFLQKKEQKKLYEFFQNLEYYPISANTIKKAYISGSNVNLKSGDILLFYESDKKGIGDIGIVESFYKNLNFDEINKTIGKRSVYSNDELNDFDKKNNSIILFIYSKKIKKVPFEELIENKILNGPPQSIQSLSHEKYLKLKKLVM